MRGELLLTCYESGADTTPLIVPFSQCFLSTDPPRTDINLGGDGSYSKSGNYLQTGTNFELPSFWTINADILETLGDRLLAMWEIREAKRIARIAPSALGYRFELDDEAQKVYEFGKTALTKTRSEVVGTTPVETDKGVYYYARRMVDMTAKPILGKIVDSYQPVTFTLKDVGVKI
jgi:hypothetical protein